MLNDDELYKRLKFLQNSVGAIPGPFDSFLVGRGLKTLALRMKEHAVNGLAVAKALEKNPRIEKVIFPGLESHPQHDLYKKQMKGFGGMMSIYIKGGLTEANNFLKELKVGLPDILKYFTKVLIFMLLFFCGYLKLFTLAESLGGYESLIEHP